MGSNNRGWDDIKPIVDELHYDGQLLPAIKTAKKPKFGTSTISKQDVPGDENPDDIKPPVV